jgi:WD40 repeat protein
LFLARQAQVLAWHSSTPEQLRTLALPQLPKPPSFEHEHDRRRGEPGDFPDRGGRAPWPLSWSRMAAAPDATRLYLIDNWSRLHVLALEGDRTRWLDWPLEIRARNLALSPDGRTLAVADRGLPRNSTEARPPAGVDRGRQGDIALIDTARGIEVARLQPTSDEDEGQITALAFASDGRELAVGTQQGLIDVWSVDHTSAPRFHLSGHRGSINALSFDPQGRHLASGGGDRTVAVWDLDIIRNELRRLGLGW